LLHPAPPPSNTDSAIVINNQSQPVKEVIKEQATAIINNTTQVVQAPVQNMARQESVPVVSFGSSSAGANAQGGGRNIISISSVPSEKEATTLVSMSELVAMQTEQNNQDVQDGSGDDAKGIAAKASDIRVPLSDTSIITLRGGGVKLPDGVDQQFYVVDKD